MKPKRLFLGILLIASAVCLILFGLGFDANLLNISVWQVLGGIICIAWIIKKIYTSKSLSGISEVLFPLAILFFIFEKNIALAIGLDSENIINNWLVILVIILLKIAFHLLFGDLKTKNYFSEKDFMLDSQNPKHFITNRFGEVNVHFRNTNETELKEISLEVENKFGEMVIHIPHDWAVECDVATSFGETKVDHDCRYYDTLVKIRGRNSFGELKVL